MNEEIKESEKSESVESNNGMIHLSQAIKFRKQAQEAENRVEILSKKLDVTNTNILTLKNELEDVSLENLLIGKLHNAGSIDIESGCLLAKKILKENKETPVDEIIENLMKRKPHLFRVFQKKTTEKNVTARSGTRKDVHDFMRNKR